MRPRGSRQFAAAFGSNVLKNGEFGKSVFCAQRRILGYAFFAFECVDKMAMLRPLLSNNQ